MSKGSRAGASTPPATADGTSSETTGEGAAAAGGGGEGTTAPPSSASSTEHTPVPPATEARRAQRDVRDALERELGVDKNIAAFLLGYFLAHRRPLEEVVQAAKELKALPTAWAPVLQSNYLGFRRACDFCGLPVVATGELQAAVSTALTL